MADIESRLEELELEARNIMYDSYTRVVYVDLTADSYLIVKAADVDMSGVKRSGCVSKWLTFFAEDGNVFRDDMEEYKDKLNIQNLCDYFAAGRQTLTMRYRRRKGNKFEWTVMEIVKAADYSEDRQTVFMMVKRLHSIFATEIDTYAELQEIVTKDSLTGLLNNYSYIKHCMLYEGIKVSSPVGVVFADLNGLKITNDTKGHEAGNDLIISFANKLREFFPAHEVYRLSGDEFLILRVAGDRADFEKRYNDLYTDVHSKEHPMGALGMEWQDAPENIKLVTQAAENRMYADKAAYYKAHPNLKREVFEKSHQEQNLAVMKYLTQAYSTVGIVDLMTDSLEIIKADESVQPAAGATVYSAYLDIMKDQILDPASLRYMQPLWGVDNLREALREDGDVSMKFHLRNGDWRETVFHKITEEDGTPTRVLFFAKKVNDYMVNIIRNNASN